MTDEEKIKNFVWDKDPDSKNTYRSLLGYDANPLTRSNAKGWLDAYSTSQKAVTGEQKAKLLKGLGYEVPYDSKNKDYDVDNWVRSQGSTFESDFLKKVGLDTDIKKIDFLEGRLMPASGITAEMRANKTPEQIKSMYDKIDPPVVNTPAPVIKAPTAPVSLLKQGTGSKVAPDEAVRAIQKQLGITADGVFGPQTKSAVMAFQQKNGLAVDGIVGPLTQKALAGGGSGSGITTPPAGTTTTVKPADDPSNKFNTDTGKLNPNNKDAQAEIAKMNLDANADQDSSLSSFIDILGTKVDVSDSSKILKALSDSTNEKPKVVSLVDTLNKKRAELGVGAKETELAGIDTEIAKLDQQITDLFGTEDDRLVSMTEIGRRKSEEQRLYEKARTELSTKRTGIVNELTQKYSVIDSIMKYTSADYENAVDDYNTKFTQAINLTNLLKNVEESNKSDAEKKADNARTNVQIMMNTLKDKNIDFTKLDSGTLLNIKNLELQSGLPSGFVKFAMEATDDPVISMGSEFTNASGQRQVPIYTKNASTGVVSVKTVTIGTAQGDKLTESEKNKTEADDIASAILDFQTQMEKKGWLGINPDAYAYYKSEILKNYGSSAILKFDKAIKDADLIVDTGK